METEKMLAGKKILLVDDEPDVLETLEDLLPMCDTVRASSFDEACAQMDAHDFDFAILDIMGVQGYQLLERANRQGIDAVMLTARALGADNVVKSLKEGAASYIPKEEMANIDLFLADILEAKAAHRHPWWRWYDRLSSFADRSFGPAFRDDPRDFLEKVPYW